MCVAVKYQPNKEETVDLTRKRDNSRAKTVKTENVRDCKVPT
jgi:hypothetical protein